MDARQIAVPDKPIRKFDWANIHYAGRDRLSESRLPTCMSPLVFHSSDSIVHQFCIAFQVYAPFFSVFSGESIRRQYIIPTKWPFLTSEHSFRCDACLCNLEMQAQGCVVGKYALCSLCYRRLCDVSLLGVVIC